MFPVLTALFITMYNSMKVDVLTFTFGEKFFWKATEHLKYILVG